MDTAIICLIKPNDKQHTLYKLYRVCRYHPITTFSFELRGRTKRLASFWPPPSRRDYRRRTHNRPQVVEVVSLHRGGAAATHWIRLLLKALSLSLSSLSTRLRTEDAPGLAVSLGIYRKGLENRMNDHLPLERSYMVVDSFADCDREKNLGSLFQK